MNENKKSLPYEPLGKQLKHLREDKRESTAEVSGAVEIEEKALHKIEAGTERPSEDILLLLISHFALEDDQAAELWQLAGYDKPQEAHEHESRSSRSQTLMVMIDPRVMYADDVEISANNRGVILNFSQSGTQPNQSLTVSRIGMSRDQAKMLMGLLHQALYDQENSDRKRLGGGQ